ncbi:endonuclease I [Bacillus sp. SA1-12]|uniref:endonuclease I family protein n=1 Tax=Bacillus sp. SA1-12 TaxID=1455638 RepID=UPI000625A757|nr:endonuclease [Bacillus sp. SA1-12]KKI92472.1 endonuclease I [Bacillus sp. SA1-12]
MGESRIGAMNESTDVKAMLIRLEQNRKRIKNEQEYYDPEQDLNIVNDYYRGIQFEADQKDLYNQLNLLVTNTHENKLPYNSETRNLLYSWVDLQLDGKLKSIYSGEKQDPEQVIIEDYEAELKRNEAFQKLIKIQTENDKALQEKIALIESENMYNCEHVVPQSWFEKDNPMRGDLHHLFTCEIKCNSTRSNLPYFDFIDYSPEMQLRAIKTNCGKYEENKFEPESGKGEAARATLYFLLRYPGEISQYRKEDVEMLVKWHLDDPVSIYEKHRNMAIFEIQKNRNPLIDFPQYAEKIDFTLGLSK